MRSLVLVLARAPAAIARPLMRATPLLLVTLAIGSVGCGDPSVKPGALVDQQELFWRLELNHHAILLSTRAPYDTLRLVATPRNYHGDVLAGLTPTFSSEDRTKVIVSPEGLLQALAPMPPQTVVRVIAMLTDSNLRHADTAYVRVTDVDPVPVLGSLSIHPIPPDSAKVASTAGFYDIDQNQRRGLYPRVTDVAGVPIPAWPGDTEGAGVLPVAFRTSDTSIIHLTGTNPTDGGYTHVAGYQPGTATVYATTMAFGVTKADTLPYRIGAPLFIFLNVLPPEANPLLGMRSSNVFSNPDIQIGVGGTVFWLWPLVGGDSNLVVDAVFHEADLPNIASVTPQPDYLNPVIYSLFCTRFYLKTDCVNSGNFVIGPVAGGAGNGSAGRRFIAPGTYEYASTRYPGSQSRIVVVDER